MRQSSARPPLRLLFRAAMVLVALILEAGCGGDEPLAPPTSPAPTTPAPSPPVGVPLADAGPRIDVCQIAHQLLAAEGAVEAVCASLVTSGLGPAGALAELTAQQRCRGCSLALGLAAAEATTCPLPVQDCPLTPNDVQACVDAAAPQLVAQLPDCHALEQTREPPQPRDWLRLVATTPSCALAFLKCPRAQRVLLDLIGGAMRGRSEP